MASNKMPSENYQSVNEVSSQPKNLNQSQPDARATIFAVPIPISSKSFQVQNMESNNFLPSVHNQSVNEVSSQPVIFTKFNQSMSDGRVTICNPPSTKLSKQFPVVNFSKTLFENTEEEIGDLEKDDDQLCRICYRDDSYEKFVYPCNCRGTSAAVHRTCIELNLNRKSRRTSSLNTCEICKAKFPVKSVRSGSFKQYISGKKNIVFTMIALILFAISVYCYAAIGIVGGLKDYRHETNNQESKGTPSNLMKTADLTLKQNISTEILIKLKEEERKSEVSSSSKDTFFIAPLISHICIAVFFVSYMLYIVRVCRKSFKKWQDENAILMLDLEE